MKLSWAATVVLIACKPNTSQFTFVDDYASAICDKAEICQWPELAGDFELCLEVVSEGMEDTEQECPDFQERFAKDCLSEVRRMTCDEGREYEDPDLHPGSCNNVYSCTETF